MRLVYVSNFFHKRAGTLYGHTFTKLLHGLIRDGHYVYPFSTNDMMRLRSPTGHTAFGTGAVNKALLEVCGNVEPDFLLLSQGKPYTPETLRELKRRHPHMPIAMIWVDPVWTGAELYGLREKLPLVDSFFLTTSGHYLEGFAGPGRVTAYIPTPTDITVDRHRAFECDAPEYDAVFFGVDVPERNRELEEIRRRCPNLRLGFFGCLGTPRVWGVPKERIMARSKMAINLSRRADMPLYSSNRLGDTTANGLLNLSPASTGLQALYRPHEAVYFDDIADLAEKLNHYAAHDAERIAIAKAGWRRSHEDFSASRVSQFMIDATLRTPGYDDVPWPQFIDEDGQKKRWQSDLLPVCDAAPATGAPARLAG